MTLHYFPIKKWAMVIAAHFILSNWLISVYGTSNLVILVIFSE